MEYVGITNQKNLHIEQIFSVHYFEYACNFSFAGESHDFWEFICVDKGNVNITAGNEHVSLHAGDIFFHKPNEFHAVHTDGKTAPNLVVVSFSCQDEIMQFFAHKKLVINRQEQILLGQLIREARYCFDCRLDDPYLKSILIKDRPVFGSQQAIFFLLEQFLIQLIRRHSNRYLSPTEQSAKKEKSTKHAADTFLFHEIVKFIQQNMHHALTVDMLAENFSISRSRLQRIFKRHCGLGIIEYSSYLKIETAKEMIRMQGMNFTQIALELGYSSIHYFSRQFKQIAGMTPSEYATSIKLSSECE